MRTVRSSVLGLCIAALAAAPAVAGPLEHAGDAASHAWQSLTGFAPAHVNGLILFSGRFGAGPNGGPLAVGLVGETAPNDRWRCAATIGNARVFSTGFTETAAREKLVPYTNNYFHCQKRSYGELFD